MPRHAIARRSASSEPPGDRQRLFKMPACVFSLAAAEAHQPGRTASVRRLQRSRGHVRRSAGIRWRPILHRGPPLLVETGRTQTRRRSSPQGRDRPPRRGHRTHGPRHRSFPRPDRRDTPQSPNDQGHRPPESPRFRPMRRHHTPRPKPSDRTMLSPWTLQTRSRRRNPCSRVTLARRRIQHTQRGSRPPRRRFRGEPTPVNRDIGRLHRCSHQPSSRAWAWKWPGTWQGASPDRPSIRIHRNARRRRAPKAPGVCRPPHRPAQVRGATRRPLAPSRPRSPPPSRRRTRRTSA